jgi:hypothetical protein
MSARSWHQRSRRLYHGNHQDWWKATTTSPAAVPRVAREYAMLPRVLERMCMDTIDRPSPQQPNCPWRSSRIAELQRKIDAANMGPSS